MSGACNKDPDGGSLPAGYISDPVRADMRDVIIVKNLATAVDCKRPQRLSAAMCVYSRPVVKGESHLMHLLVS